MHDVHVGEGWMGCVCHSAHMAARRKLQNQFSLLYMDLSWWGWTQVARLLRQVPLPTEHLTSPNDIKRERIIKLRAKWVI